MQLLILSCLARYKEYQLQDCSSWFHKQAKTLPSVLFVPEKEKKERALAVSLIF